MLPHTTGVPLKWSASSTFTRAGGTSASNVNGPVPAAVVHHTALLQRLTDHARRAARDLLGEELEDGEEPLSLLRLRTRSHELLVAPAAEATLAVMQRAHSAAFDGYPGLNDDTN
jgi:hypothetical protein